jgi:hypothetical protein
MKSLDDVKAFYKDATVDTNPAQDNAVLTDALQAGGLKASKRAAHAEPSMWRAIMKNRKGQLATAALIIIALLVIIGQFGGSIDGTTVAWGEVRDAFLGRPWVYLKYDNGAEQWYDLKTGDHFFKDWDGRCVAIDHAANLRHVYDPISPGHTREDRPVVYHDDVIPPWEPKTAWEAIVGPWEQMAQQGGSSHWEVETSADEADGQRRVRFDRYFNDAAGRRLLVRQIWADPQTRLPLTVWKRLSLADRKDQQREAITGTFDFPNGGPQSIYDLGVARDLPVVKNYDKTALSSIAEVMQAGKDALGRFPARYRAVVWDNERTSEVDIVWRNGENIRHDRYFNLPPTRTPQHHLRLPVTAREALDWAQTQPPISTNMFDGQREYRRSYLHPEVSNTRDRVRVTRADNGFFLPTGSKPIEAQWPYANRNPASFELIDDAPEELRSYIGLRINGADNRREYYIDPEHDYICVRWIWWKQRSGTWEKEREYAYSDLTRLPEGQWYARKRILVTYPDPDRGTSRGGSNRNIDVEPLEEGDFPPETFNGQRLTEGAELETY